MTDALREALERLRALSVRPQPSSDDVDAALAIICEALDVPMGKILQLVEGGTLLLVRWGVGWKQGVVGHSTVSTKRGSLAGYAVAQKDVVVVDDVMATSRFADADLLRFHEVQSVWQLASRARGRHGAC